MKVILDTNVLISGIFFKGPPHDILIEWDRKKFNIVITHAILEEYKDVIDELSNQFPHINVIEIVERITLNAHLTFSVVLNEKICRE